MMHYRVDWQDTDGVVYEITGFWKSREAMIQDTEGRFGGKILSVLVTVMVAVRSGRKI